jgi:hypothetical protein
LKVTSLFKDVIKQPAENFTLYKNESLHNFGLTDKNNKFLIDTAKYDSIEKKHDQVNSIHSAMNDGYEMVIKVDLGPTPVVERGSSLRFNQIEMDDDGRIINENSVKQIVFRGGIDHELRCFMWKFLLGYHDWNSTTKMRTEERIHKENSYFRIKLQWESIDAQQKEKFSM